MGWAATLTAEAPSGATRVANHPLVSFSSSFSGDSGDDEDDENEKEEEDDDDDPRPRLRLLRDSAPERKRRFASSYLVRDARTLFVFRASRSAAAFSCRSSAAAAAAARRAAIFSSRLATSAARFSANASAPCLQSLAALSRDAWSTEKQHGTRKIKQATK